MRDVGFFLSLEHLEAIVGLLLGLISTLFVSGNREAHGEGERWGMAGGGAGRTHDTCQLSSSYFMGTVPGAPNNDNSNLKDR